MMFMGHTPIPDSHEFIMYNGAPYEVPTIKGRLADWNVTESDREGVIQAWKLHKEDYRKMMAAKQKEQIRQLTESRLEAQKKKKLQDLQLVVDYRNAQLNRA